MKRRTFLRKAALSTAALSQFSLLGACSTLGQKGHRNSSPPKISLAQWSLHRQLEKRELKAEGFARIAREDYGIEAVEYVNGFYSDFGTDEKFWMAMKGRAGDAGVKSLLIMVDEEGDLGHSNGRERRKAVENHFKWVHAAKILGCHSIRVNAFGEGSRDAIRAALVDGMGQLVDYAAREKINVLIENHGLHTSDAAFIAGIIAEVDSPYFGALPDFGNWCTSAKWGSTQVECAEAYDRYQGVAELMPYAKAVSAKSYDFDETGEDTRIDYGKMLKIVQEAGYDGYIGIEYEGNLLSEHDGILATKGLIERHWA